jgi:hypothetical protein
MVIKITVRDSHAYRGNVNLDELADRQDIEKISDRRVKRIRPLIPPQILNEDLPLYVCPASY